MMNLPDETASLKAQIFELLDENPDDLKISLTRQQIASYNEETLNVILADIREILGTEKVPIQYACPAGWYPQIQNVPCKEGEELRALTPGNTIWGED